MAIQEISNLNAITQEFARSTQDAGSGPGGSPYMEAREFAARLGDHAQFAVGEFKVDAAGAADGVEVTLGFQPKFLCAYNVSTNETFFKFLTDAFFDTNNNNEKKAANRVAGGTSTVKDNTFMFTKIDGSGFGTSDNPGLGGFSLRKEEAVDTEIYAYIAIG